MSSTASSFPSLPTKMNDDEEFVGKLLGGDRADVVDAVAKVLRPLIGNLLREPSNPKFQKVNGANPKIASALRASGCREVFQLAGFREADGSWEFVGGTKTLLDADRVLTEFETRAEQQRLEASHGAFKPVVANSRAMEKAEAEAAAAKEDVLRRLHQDRLEVQRRAKQKEEEEKLAALQEEDFLAAEHLLETAKKTIHYHGRLRNAAFDARDMRIRRMVHGRGLVCECPPENLEVHWHVRTASLFYGYVVHLSSDATKVIHVGPEDGYQYNSLPGTEHFGKVLHISSKTVDADGKVHCATPNTVVAECKLCLTPFLKLMA